MTERPDGTDPLAAHFAALKARPARPAPDLMARILADADAVQAERAAASSCPACPARPRARPLAAAIRALGGWPAMAGLATAAVAGVWIGIDPPSGLVGAARTVLDAGDGGYLVDFDPGMALILAEGAS